MTHGEVDDAREVDDALHVIHCTQIRTFSTM